jgi:ubiquinone/menaquinone biosynthesis C-methylase UbiE
MTNRSVQSSAAPAQSSRPGAAPNRLLQLAGCAIVWFLFFGGMYTPFAPWRVAVFRVWLLGTQQALGGIVWLAALVLLPRLLSNRDVLPLAPGDYVGWLVLGWIISIAPFLIYRTTGRRRPEFLFTLTLPLWGVAFQWLGQRVLPAGVFSLYSLSPMASARTAPLQVFLILWAAAVMLWIWDREFQLPKISLPKNAAEAVALLRRARTRQARTPQNWSERTDTLALLRSPKTGETLRVASGRDGPALVSPSGESFPIHRGIPAFCSPDALGGSNRKFSVLYKVIAGFYDDIQRIVCLLRGTTRYRYAMSYLRALEVEPGQSVLETSVGTGLNFKCLPKGVKLLGLDLSANMLERAQENMIRWGLDADLFLGNAEELPFADDSVDVVFHTGGINFFNDRAKAIREMIRVAKPGSRLLIADETEAHAKSVYERTPLIGKFFRNRREPISAPVDLVPPQMRDVHVELLRDGRFYSLTFRKPLTAANR